jgi:hypothetical protein
VEATGDGAAVADLAEDYVVVQLHLHLLATIDSSRNGDAQARAGDVQDVSVYRLGRTRQDFELGGILRGVTGFGAAFAPGWLSYS